MLKCNQKVPKLFLFRATWACIVDAKGSMSMCWQAKWQCQRPTLQALLQGNQKRSVRFLISQWMKLKYIHNMCSNCFRFGQPKVGTSYVVKTRAPCLAISYKPDSSGEGWKCLKISFGAVCFTTSKWAYQQLHQVSACVKLLGMVLRMNVLQGVGFKNCFK